MANIDNKPCEYCSAQRPAITVDMPSGPVVIGYRPCSCPDALAAAERERLEEERTRAKQKEAEHFKAYTDGGFPSKFWDHEHQKQADLADHVQSGTGLYITACVGAGKTRLACCIAHELIRRGYKRLSFMAAVDVAEQIRSTYSRNARYTEDELINRWKYARVLIIDDLGKGEMKDKPIGAIFSVLDYRYRENLPVIVTSQYERDELIQRLAENGDEETAVAIASRLNEVNFCARVKLKDIDHRIPKVC